MAKEEQHNSTYLHLAVYEKSLYDAIRPKSDSFKLWWTQKVNVLSVVLTGAFINCSVVNWLHLCPFHTSHTFHTCPWFFLTNLIELWVLFILLTNNYSNSSPHWSMIYTKYVIVQDKIILTRTHTVMPFPRSTKS